MCSLPAVIAAFITAVTVVEAAPGWPVEVAPNAELLAVAELRGRSIRLQVDTGSAVSWVASENCWLRTLEPDTGRQIQSAPITQRATLPLDLSVSAHRNPCEAVAELGSTLGQLWKGAAVVVQKSEELVAACVAHRGKRWEDVRAKRYPRLGARGVVRKLENKDGRVAVKVEFDSDGETMWWRPEFLGLAGVPLGGSVNPPPDVEYPRGPGPREQECLQMHYADETDVHGGCALLNLTYATLRGGRASLGGALFGVARWMGEQVHLSEGFDRAEVAWDGMLGLAPPHAKHRPFEKRWVAKDLELPVEGRVSHSLVESMLLRTRSAGNRNGVAFTLSLGPWHTAASLAGSRPYGRYGNGVPWSEDDAAAEVGGVPGMLKLEAQHSADASSFSTGPVTVLPQQDGTR
eukprot:COSAG05_NODE_1328_length_5166_cov_4.355634_1_plen_405_part_00